MPQTETWTIGRLLAWTQKYLAERGADSPRLDAEILLATARGCPRIALYTAFDEEPSEPVRTAFRELVRRRSEGAPVAYLVGRREFYSLSFRVTPDVLIPRPETELVVVQTLDRAKPRPVGDDAGARSAPPAELRIADVGTGSGAIAVTLAKHLPQAELLALDISPAALAVAEANAAEHGVAARVKCLESDLLAAVPAEPRLHFIVSNPPYVSTAEMAALPRDVARHEPRLALEAGPTGTEVIARLIPQALERLLPSGWLILEISPQIEPPVRNLLAEGGFDALPCVKDLAGHPRVMVARKL